MKIEYSQIRCAYSSTDENTISTKIEHMMSLPCIPFLVFRSSFPQTTRNFSDIHIVRHHISIVLHTPSRTGARTEAVNTVSFVLDCWLSSPVRLVVLELDMLLIHMPFTLMKYGPLCSASPLYPLRSLHANDNGRRRLPIVA